MQNGKSVEMQSYYCQGEVGKVIFAGAPELPGVSMIDKMRHINEVDDSFRRFVTHEPRAHAAMSVNLLLPPCRPDADTGFIVMLADRAHPMSGSNCICVVTFLIESGRVAITEPETIVRLDTPAGLVTARAYCVDGRCVSVSIENVPCFTYGLDIKIDTPKWGAINADIAFGGVFYGIVDVDQIGLAITPQNARDLAAAGIEIRELMEKQTKVQHPTQPDFRGITNVMFRSLDSDGATRTCTTLRPGRIDRTPCGTGSSANLAALFSRGDAKIGDKRLSRSIVGGEFILEVAGETMVGDEYAIVPRITGSAWCLGTESLIVRPEYPSTASFMMSDTWGLEI
ncbi:proline racemase family protein [Brucella pituitosa]|uniref:proline racemase family protein n=1 Tax=Brucella pituitosa TaxID=571256 RepID=UPI003F4AE7CB